MTCAIIGLIFSIVALFIFGLPFSMIALILGVIGISGQNKKPGQTALSVVVISLGAIELVVTLFNFAVVYWTAM